MTLLLWLDLAIILGLACIWMGALILWVGGLPRQLRRGEVPTAPKGTPEAFGLFWLDQYGYIGLTTLGVGAVLLVLSLLL